jgi:hypothetical protein
MSVTSGTRWRRQHLPIWLALIILCSLSTHAQEPARLAPLIGNQAYAAKVGPLQNPQHDVTLIEAIPCSIGGLPEAVWMTD